MFPAALGLISQQCQVVETSETTVWPPAPEAVDVDVGGIWIAVFIGIAAICLFWAGFTSLQSRQRLCLSLAIPALLLGLATGALPLFQSSFAFQSNLFGASYFMALGELGFHLFAAMALTLVALGLTWSKLDPRFIRGFILATAAYSFLAGAVWTGAMLAGLIC